MRILLFGTTGQLGSECASLFAATNHELIPLSRADVDFSDESAIINVVEKQTPDIVINACAYTAVDKAEEDRVTANQVNHLSVACLANVCRDIDAMLIHISTDYVFDGLAHIAYSETDPTSPLSVYGKTKLLGENALLDSGVKGIILRTSWVFGKQGSNFVKTMLRLASEREALSIVSDQRGRPTYAGHIANVIGELVDIYQSTLSLPWGVYHCCSDGDVSWFEFAQAIFEQAVAAKVLANLPVLNAIPTSAYPTPAPRPSFSVLNTQKLETLLGRSMPHWKLGLSDFFAN